MERKIAQLLMVMKRSWYVARKGMLTFLNSIFIALVLLLLPIAIGFAGKGHEAAIMDSWPLNVHAGIQDEVMPIYKALVCFLVLFSLREWAKSVGVKEREKELLQAIRTMPPPNVLEKFHALHTEVDLYIAQQVEAQQSPSEKKEAIDQGIRLCLNTLIELVSAFQRSTAGARYAANFMTYRPLESLTDATRVDLVDEMAPYLDRASLEGLDGVLDLDTNLTATSTSKTPFDGDVEVRRLVLPVPSPRQSPHNDKTRCLPGAPTALTNGQYIVNDTLKILDEYDKSQSYEVVRGVFQNIDDYFRKDKSGKRVRSFLSISVPHSNRAPPAQRDPKPQGVINIHSDKVNLFADTWVFDSYRYVVSPMVERVAYLVSLRT